MPHLLLGSPQTISSRIVLYILHLIFCDLIKEISEKGQFLEIEDLLFLSLIHFVLAFVHAHTIS